MPGGASIPNKSVAGMNEGNLMPINQHGALGIVLRTEFYCNVRVRNFRRTERKGLR